jgi:uncharacterized membrane protein
MSARALGRAGAVGALGAAVCAVVVAGVVVPSSTVPDDRWSYPWSAAALVPVSLLYAGLHALVLLGLLGLTRGGAGRVGAWIAVAGTAVLTLAELASIPIADQPMSATGAGLVGATFGLGTLLSAVGFLVAGVAAVRAGSAHGWRRYLLLVTGIWTAVMIGLVSTPLLPVAVGVYGLLLTAVFLTLPAPPGTQDLSAEQPAAAS